MTNRYETRSKTKKSPRHQQEIDDLNETLSASRSSTPCAKRQRIMEVESQEGTAVIIPASMKPANAQMHSQAMAIESKSINSNRRILHHRQERIWPKDPLLDKSFLTVAIEHVGTMIHGELISILIGLDPKYEFKTTAGKIIERTSIELYKLSSDKLILSTILFFIQNPNVLWELAIAYPNLKKICDEDYIERVTRQVTYDLQMYSHRLNTLVYEYDNFEPLGDVSDTAYLATVQWHGRERDVAQEVKAKESKLDTHLRYSKELERLEEPRPGEDVTRYAKRLFSAIKYKGQYVHVSPERMLYLDYQDIPLDLYVALNTLDLPCNVRMYVPMQIQFMIKKGITDPKAWRDPITGTMYSRVILEPNSVVTLHRINRDTFEGKFQINRGTIPYSTSGEEVQDETLGKVTLQFFAPSNTKASGNACIEEFHRGHPLLYPTMPRYISSSTAKHVETSSLSMTD